jgi:hypothetical protein
MSLSISAGVSAFVNGTLQDGNVMSGLATQALDLFVSYNTTLPFSTPTSYQTVSLTSVTGATLAKGFTGGALDPNGFVYFVPFGGNFPNTSGLVVRFDTSKLLTDSTAYSTFDVTTLAGQPSGSPLTGYAGACGDGRWVYFAPFGTSANLNSSTPSYTAHGWALRYDTTRSFAASASWEAYNLAASVSTSASGLMNCISNGQSVYFLPYLGTVIAAYAIGPTLALTTAWSTFDLANIGITSAKWLGGANVLGRYMYFVPWGDNVPSGTKRSVIARFDTQALGGLASVGSWTTFDLTTISSAVSKSALGYEGALTDGVRLYLVPAYNANATNVAPYGVPPFLRYDARQDFTDPASWLPMGGTTVIPSATGIQSAYAASDGIYGYLGPNWDWSGGGNGAPGGKFYRWRIRPASPDAQAPLIGMSTQFFLAPNGDVGFGNKSPSEQVHSGANVRADGLLLGQLGTSGQVAQASATAYATAIGTPTGSGPWTLASYVLPASALSVVNKGVRVRAFGTYNNNSNTKNVFVYFGATQILNSGSVGGVPFSQGGTWFLEAMALQQGISPVTQVAGGMIVSAPSGTNIGSLPASAFTALSAAIGSPITIAVVATTTGTLSSDVTLDAFTVDFIN